MRARDLRAARDVVPQDVRHAVEEVAHQRLAPLLLVGRPRRRCRPQPGDGHDQHDERRGLAAAAPPGGDEEARPVRQQRALDQGERGGDDCRTCRRSRWRRRPATRRTGTPSPPSRAPGCSPAPCGMIARSSSWMMELDAALAVEALRGQQVPIGQDEGRRWRMPSPSAARRRAAA